MKTYTIAAILAAKAASQRYDPYGSPTLKHGYTRINPKSERISEVKIYKGSNGCLSGFSLRSHSGNYTVTHGTDWEPTQAPGP